MESPRRGKPGEEFWPLIWDPAFLILMARDQGQKNISDRAARICSLRKLAFSIQACFVSSSRWIANCGRVCIWPKEWSALADRKPVYSVRCLSVSFKALQQEPPAVSRETATALWDVFVLFGTNFQDPKVHPALERS